MLVQISIRNFAIVDGLELELGPGTTALTGETGAGKSILVDALALAAGGRASSQQVRPGCERTEVSAVFEIGGVPAARALLNQLEIEDPESQCVLRRIVGADGRSRAFVNGVPVAVGTLKSLGDVLMDIHGQHAHHALVRREEQLRILDEYAGHRALLDEVAGIYRDHADVCGEIDALSGSGEDPGVRLDYLRFQLSELEALELTESGLVELNEEHARLGHVSELKAATEAAMLALDDDEGGAARAQLVAAARALGRIETYDSGVSGARGLLEEAAIDVDEALNQIKRYRDGLDADPQRLEILERRLSAIHDIARKHRVEPDALPALTDRLRAEAERLASSGERMAELEDRRASLVQAFGKAAARLSKSRAKAAERLAKEVGDNLQRLGMGGARFKIAVTPEESRPPAAGGTDRVEFQVAPNPGLPISPVARTASGGELSRISLAIQVVDVSATAVPTIVFDEVDVGVGGGHAEVVGRMLRSLAEHRQVLCVTHLPQVASQATHHLRVVKTATRKATTTAIEHLNGEQRVKEVARMLGGIEVTQQTVAHAREMIEKA